MTPDEPTLGELTRAVNRLEVAIRDQTLTFTEEVRTVRHRVNNLEASREGDKVRFSNIEKATQKLEESQTWAFRFVAAAFVAILIEAVVLAVRTAS